MKTTTLLLLTCLLAGAFAGEIPTAAEQIAAAIEAAPEEWRAGAGVLGYDADGKLGTLREGSNHLICLADKPGNDRFSVACYHKDLEPYMARGRELIAQGVTGKKRNDVRWKEIADGKLAMSREPRTLYVLSGSGFDAGAGKVMDPYLRWVIYTPYSTPESLGLSPKAAPGVPWLMFPGTAGAHVMISPPRKK
ncbi:MAG: hypothetical protein GY953_28245 [bacterium]|nr:hypothetical protein [bacterium]